MNKFSGPLARRYGTALFECAIEASQKGDSNLFNQFVESSQTILLYFNKKITSFFMNPTLSLEEKKDLFDTVINKIFNNKKIPTELSDFLKLMLENNRFSELQMVLKNFLMRADEYAGVSRAIVISASQINNGVASEFSSILQSVLNKKIIIETEVDASLRSGFIIKVGNISVDASLRSRLLNLKESLS